MMLSLTFQNDIAKQWWDFFLERFILIPENGEIFCGPRDQRKGRHFHIMSTSNSSLNIHFCVETEIQVKP